MTEQDTHDPKKTTANGSGAQVVQIAGGEQDSLGRTDDALMQHLRAAIIESNRPAWWPVLQAWLAQFAELHSMLVTIEDLPTYQILAVFAERPEASDPVIAESLGRCDFLCWRAYRVNELGQRDGEAWDWRVDSLMNFRAQGETVMYQSDRERPNPSETSAWLLSRLVGPPAPSNRTP